MIGGTNVCRVLDTKLLNAVVIGGRSQPQNPADMTIWIDSPIDVTDYVISYNRPVRHKNGSAWIEIRSDSDNNLNIIENVNIGIGFVQQYINNDWRFVTGKIYYNSVWTPIQNWLYYEGTYNTTLGGVWTRNNDSGTYLDEDAFFEKTAGSSNYSSGCAIDLTNVNSVIFDLEVLSAGTYNFGYLSVSRNSGSYDNTWTNAPSTARIKLGSSATRQKMTLNVSDLSGKYYVTIGANSSSGTSRVRVFSIELR